MKRPMKVAPRLFRPFVMERPFYIYLYTANDLAE